MKGLLTLAVAALLAAPVVADEKEQKSVLPKGAELVAELNGHGHDFVILTNKKNGNALLYRVKRIEVKDLSEQQQQELKEQNPDGDVRAARSPVLPGGRVGLVYLGTMPHVLLARASTACQSLALSRGFYGSYTTGYPGAFHCYGQGAYVPAPIPEPWPVPWHDVRE